MANHLFEAMERMATEEANCAIDEAQDAFSTSVFFAISRVLRDVYYESAASRGAAGDAAKNALYLCGRFALCSVCSFTGNLWTNS